MNAQEYYDWLSKFEPKYTTDDCYTPPAVYDAVVQYVNEHILSLEGLNIIRPFYPNGDYTDLSQYDENSIVIDNPPFSLSYQIYRFYQKHGIKFFLFAPALTLFQGLRKTDGITAIIAPYSVTYANGAVVNTSFTTNLTPHLKVKACPVLYEALRATDLNTKKTKILLRYKYPDNLVMVGDLHKLCKSGVGLDIAAEQATFVDALDHQKKYKKKCFGGGLMVSGHVAKELQAKELQAKELQDDAIVWELSEREKQIIEKLNQTTQAVVF